MSDLTTREAIALGREALARHEWHEAYDALAEADRVGSMPGEGLELKAWAAYWTARPDETIDALERAYAAYVGQGDRAAAAMIAFRLAEQHGMRMSVPMAQGWAAKAAQLAEVDPELPVHGWLIWMQGLLAWFQGDLERAVSLYDEALVFAGRIDDKNLAAMSLHDKGHALCLLGAVAEGMALLDECMATVVGGELEPAAAGYVYCGMIGVCSKLGDYGRASEWTDSTLRWCERQSVPAFPGVCRVHRAELLRLHGSLDQAEEEARAACEELPRFNFFSGMGPANYEIGEVRRRLGDLDSAEEAYARAEGFGFRPQPGLSLLRLEEGNAPAAAAEIRRALEDVGGNHCARIRLLAAQTDIALAQEDLDTATSAAQELRTIVGEFATASLRAMSLCADGAVYLARGDASAALPALRRAREDWLAIDAPYEAAEVGLLLARAYAATDDAGTAAMEARAARTTFEELGAQPAAHRAARFLGGLAASADPAERVGRAFMFTDIVRSTELIGVIGDEAWENLLTWHDRTLRSLFASHRGEISHPTGDGFFVSFADARSAVRCAVAVQRALAEHRRSHGFALLVRIGIHAGEATRRGQDYGGSEVHKAARIAAAADGGEILASRDALDGTDDDFTITDVGDVALKGFADPVAVGRVNWQ